MHRPGLVLVSQERRDDQLLVHYRCSDRQVALLLRLHEKRWLVAGIDLPTFRTRPFTEALKSFEAAWNQRGTKALEELFTQAYREGYGRELLHELEARQWTRSRPRISGGQAAKDLSDGTGLAAWKLADAAHPDAELRVAFEWWRPRWRVSKMRLPEP